MIYILNFLTFFIILFALYKVAKSLNFVDKPNLRKIHSGEIPLLGGIIIYLNLFIYSFLFGFNDLERLIFLTSGILVILGALDDYMILGIKFRLFAQLLCSLVVIGSGLLIQNIGAYMFIQNIEIGFLSVLFTVFCIMGLTNSFNFIDGLDGLCSSTTIISIISIFLFAFFDNKIDQSFDFTFFIFFILNLLFFILFNLSNSYKIFLGDAGSLFLGFYVSCLLIYFSQSNNNILHPVLTIWCVTLPVYDIFSVTFRRIINKKSPFNADRTHIHHFLLQVGFSQKKVLILICLLSIFLNALGFIIYLYLGPMESITSFFILMAIYIYFKIKYFDKAKI